MGPETTMQHIDPNVVKARRIEGGITLAVCAVIVLGLLFFTVQFNWPYWIVIAVAGLTVVLIPLELFIIPEWTYRTWRYAISEHEIELHHGIFFRKRTLVPFVRVQHVDAKQGPILRKYGLSTVTFSTAAGSHEIPALSEETAERVRRQIVEIARIADDGI